MAKIRYLSLFAGIEAWSCAVQNMPEYEPVAFAEVDPFASAVLAHHYPNVKNLGDVTKIDGKPLRGKVDLIVGGSPCFTAGTMVLTPSGYRPIEDLQVGDEVVSGKGAIRRITAAGNRIAEVGRMVVGDGVGKTFDIVCTPNHPFLCFPKRGRDNDWVPAFDTVGRNVCHGPALKPHIASPVLSFTLEGFDVVYNITVEEDHDYIVNGLIVHNCQGFSVAGLREGLGDPRSALALTYVRLVKEIQPKWLLWENVPGILSCNHGQDFRSFLAALDELNYSLAGTVLDSQWFGVPQRRRRMFVVGCAGADWESCTKIFFEPQSMCRNPPARRKEREGDSAGAEGGARNSGVSGTLCASGAGLDRPSAQGNQLDYLVQDVAFAQNQRDEVRQMEVAGALAAEPGMHQQTFVVVNGDAKESKVSPTLGTDVRNGPTGRFQAQAAVVEPRNRETYQIANGVAKKADVAPTLDVRCRNGCMQEQAGDGNSGRRKKNPSPVGE